MKWGEGIALIVAVLFLFAVWYKAGYLAMWGAVIVVSLVVLAVIALEKRLPQKKTKKTK